MRAPARLSWSRRRGGAQHHVLQVLDDRPSNRGRSTLSLRLRHLALYHFELQREPSLLEKVQGRVLAVDPPHEPVLPCRDGQVHAHLEPAHVPRRPQRPRPVAARPRRCPTSLALAAAPVTDGRRRHRHHGGRSRVLVPPGSTTTLEVLWVVVPNDRISKVPGVPPDEAARLYF